MKRKQQASQEAASPVEAVSKLIVDDGQRERFLQLMARLRKLPEDDDQLQFMEIVGFTTLILDKLPNEIATALEKVEAGLSEDQVGALQRRFEEVLKNSIDTPSYKDLRESVREMKEERHKFEHRIYTVTTAIKELPAIPYPGTFKATALVSTGLVCLVLGALAMFAGLSASLWRPPIPVPPVPDPSSLAFSDGSVHPQIATFVEYFEDTLPSYDEPIGIFVVNGGILEVHQEPDKGIVVMALGPDHIAEHETK